MKVVDPVLLKNPSNSRFQFCDLLWLEFDLVCPKILPGVPNVSAVKNPSAVQETWILSLDLEDPLEKEMATHCSMFAWKTPWTESLVGYSP